MAAKDDSNRLANKILLSLPRKEYRKLFPRLEFVALPLRLVLNEMAKPIEYGYFMNGGLASILAVMADGKSVEVGLTGAEGFVGVPLIAGFRTSATRVIVQIEGSAFRIKAKNIMRLLRGCPTLEKELQRYAQEVALQSGQIAACNRLHDVSRRLARWLLMSQDRVGGNTVRLTQEFLAHMLGTRRASVTVAAGNLQKERLITYTRGEVKIENRSRLEAASCECYASLWRQSNKWQEESNAGV
jgi:CRP-like cAMP-binding protein